MIDFDKYRKISQDCGEFKKLVDDFELKINEYKDFQLEKTNGSYRQLEELSIEIQSLISQINLGMSFDKNKLYDAVLTFMEDEKNKKYKWDGESENPGTVWSKFFYKGSNFTIQFEYDRHDVESGVASYDLNSFIFIKGDGRVKHNISAATINYRFGSNTWLEGADDEKENVMKMLQVLMKSQRVTTDLYDIVSKYVKQQ